MSFLTVLYLKFMSVGDEELVDLARTSNDFHSIFKSSPHVFVFVFMFKCSPKSCREKVISLIADAIFL